MNYKINILLKLCNNLNKKNKLAFSLPPIQILAQVRLKNKRKVEVGVKKRNYKCNCKMIKT